MPATAWTPATDSSTLPRASTANGDFGPHRAYFYDLETREEMTDHPLNGMMWGSSGPMISVAGAYVDATILSVSGTAYLDGVARCVRVTAESFPGRKVAVKTWHGEGKPSWRVLARGDDSKVEGKKPRIGREWIAAFKRGEVL